MVNPDDAWSPVKSPQRSHRQDKNDTGVRRKNDTARSTPAPPKSFVHSDEPWQSTSRSVPVAASSPRTPRPWQSPEKKNCEGDSGRSARSSNHSRSNDTIHFSPSAKTNHKNINNTNSRNGNNPTGSLKNRRTRSHSFASNDQVELYQPDNNETNVKRRNFDQIMSRRMKYLDINEDTQDVQDTQDTQHMRGLAFALHERYAWVDPHERHRTIQQQMKLLWDLKPLQLNEDTRWKPKVLQNHEQKETPSDQQQQQKQLEEDTIRRATAILNKLSWTSIDKLTVTFLEALATSNVHLFEKNEAPEASSPTTAHDTISKTLIQSAMELVVAKAMGEPHFAELYANLVARLYSIHKIFKKVLLHICQAKFELVDKESSVPSDASPEEKEYWIRQQRIRAVGLMKFIGELYKLRLIKGRIMIGCLQRLIAKHDEEQLECFTKLMTTAGQRLDNDEEEYVEEIEELWEGIASLAGKRTDGPVAPNTRVKFLFQDLLLLRENGWIKFREEENKAKTLAEIYQEVQQEERNPDKMFTRAQSMGSMLRRKNSTPGSPVSRVPMSSRARKLSQRGYSDTVDTSSGGLQHATANPTLPRQPKSGVEGNDDHAISYIKDRNVHLLEPSACGERAKNAMKEYFVSGEVDDIVLTLRELVAIEHEGNVERGSKVVESIVLLVMEMKLDDATKASTVISRCVQESYIEDESIQQGLNDPLEFLRDIEIDAPMAPYILATFMARLIDDGALRLSVLLDAPSLFLSEGRPVDFAIQILQHLTVRGISDDEVTVVKLLLQDSGLDTQTVRGWIQQHMK